MYCSVIPASRRASASDSLATITRGAPSSTCRFAHLGLLWVLVCGTRSLPSARASSAMPMRFRSVWSRSTTTAGVSMVFNSSTATAPPHDACFRQDPVVVRFGGIHAAPCRRCRDGAQTLSGRAGIRVRRPLQGHPKTVHLPRPPAEERESVMFLDEAEQRRVVEHGMMDAGSKPSGEEQARHAKSGAEHVLDRGRHVVEEAARLVEGDDQQGLAP